MDWPSAISLSGDLPAGRWAIPVIPLQPGRDRLRFATRRSAGTFVLLRSWCCPGGADAVAVTFAGASLRRLGRGPRRSDARLAFTATDLLSPSRAVSAPPPPR